MNVEKEAQNELELLIENDCLKNAKGIDINELIEELEISEEVGNILFDLIQNYSK